MATRTRKKTQDSTPRPAGRTAVVEDRREAPRLAVPRVEADVTSVGLRVTVLEVGFGGFSIESSREFKIGEVHTVRAATSDSDAAALRARVKHGRAAHARNETARYVTGFEFVDPWGPGDRSPVDEFISQVTRGLSRATPD